VALSVRVLRLAGCSLGDAVGSCWRGLSGAVTMGCDAMDGAIPPDLDRCAGCGDHLLLGDMHCGGCGKTVASSQTQAMAAHLAAQRLQRLRTNRTIDRTVNRASGVVGLLSLIFFLSAVGASVRGRTDTRKIRDMLATHPQEQVLNVEGEPMTVAQAQAQVRQMVVTPFVVNMVLAFIMLVLFFWARVSPLPAILVAASMFAMVHVFNAVLAPESLREGIVIKAFALVTLAIGIRAAVQHRGQAGAAGRL
jgi:hypothetical protein